MRNSSLVIRLCQKNNDLKMVIQKFLFLFLEFKNKKDMKKIYGVIIT